MKRCRDGTTENHNSYEEAVDFVNRVMLRNESIFKSLVKILNSYQKERYAGSNHVYDEVVALLVDHQDLLDQFFAFMSMESYNKQKIQKQGIGFFRKVEKKLSLENYMEFLKCFSCYSSGKIQKGNFKIAVANIIGESSNPELMEDFRVFMKNCENFYGLLNKGEKKSKKITPSYGVAPEGYNCNANQRKENAAEILNDNWVSVGSCTEYQSWKRGRDQDQEIKIMCEDDRHELDMLMIWLNSAAKFAEELCKGTKETEVGGMSRTHFFRCVEHLYGESGLHILEIWQENPKSASAVILARLKEKIEQLTSFSAELEKVWARAQTL
ncbi:hypothetical protein JCGZ_01117 [Jatropha curcas]|uniref:Histone deacetylase interacting domain-containing protein n=1 Tax=Jatropha curcas TaxID=180498 RepID=A0A067L4D2_JATCU|nr:paired amphipathic helix protein Sin3-like 1 [Jatropha curcas]KDP39360.1 hypothetical protein JCGZ_01117 [Jatropha curcas]